MRNSEATLASSFAPLQLKKFELEFSIDPLFKKASADFDEGGAKGLLLNNLAIDPQGKIVFDSSDGGDNTETPGIADGDLPAGIEDELSSLHTMHIDTNNILKGSDLEDDTNIDLTALKTQFFQELESLNSQDICPSLSKYHLGDPKSELNIPFLKALDTQVASSPTLLGLDENPGLLSGYDGTPSFDEDDVDVNVRHDGLDTGSDVPQSAAFGEGGDIWAKDAILESQIGLRRDDMEENVADDMTDQLGCFDTDASRYGIISGSDRNRMNHQDILSYFDSSTEKNWAGPEHWKIQRVKDTNSNISAAATKRKEKDPFEIDFLSPLNRLATEAIYSPATSSSSISLPKAQWATRRVNLLPDDKHFSSHQLLRLFLKPRARLASKRRDVVSSRLTNVQAANMDENFWARQAIAASLDEIPGTRLKGSYDANFFQDDGLVLPSSLQDDDDDDFADAREAFSPSLECPGNETTNGIDNVLSGTFGGTNDGYGSQLITQNKRTRPDYVQYARVAKKVDVRRLKEEMWKGIGDGKVGIVHWASYIMLMLIA